MVWSAYFLSDSTEMPPPTEFEELVKYYSEKKLELQVGKDAHAHQTVWVRSDVNPREKSLREYPIAQGLLGQNKTGKTTFITSVRQEILHPTV